MDYSSDIACQGSCGASGPDIWTLPLSGSSDPYGKLTLLSDVTAAARPDLRSAHKGGTSPATLVPMGFEAQAYAAFENLTTLLASAGSGIEELVAMRCRVSDLSEEETLRRVSKEYLGEGDVDFIITETAHPSADSRCLLALSGLAVSQ